MLQFMNKTNKHSDDATPIVTQYEYNSDIGNQIHHELRHALKRGSGSEHAGIGRRVWPWACGIPLLLLGIISFIALILVQTSEGIGVLNRSEPPALSRVGSSRVRGGEAETVVACYFVAGENSSAALAPASVPARLCTHVLAGFARVTRAALALPRALPAALRDLAALRKTNPRLKIMLSVGGAGEKDGFSDMVKDHASRKIFIKSIKFVLKNYSLDGIDLDWEFPVLHDGTEDISSRERQHFSQLLREIRMEFDREKRGYVLSVALAAQQTIVDVAYDVDQINLYVDFANLMTYDFHSYTKFTPFTGFNSPLYARSTEGLFLATLNINYTVEMYLNKGLDRNKIVVGIPTYGHTYTLVNEENASVGSPARGWGAVGARGFADYPALCALAARAARRWDAEARVPYLWRGAEWASCEEPRSARLKAAFVRARRLRGAMLYSLNADDHAARCAPPARFPLTAAVAAALRDNDTDTDTS